jgi:ABC-type nitrate/sulfonate/bicarbonate transport system permease component
VTAAVGSIAARGHSSRRRQSGIPRAWIVTALSAVAILIVWEVAADLWLDGLGVIASPSEILTSIVTHPLLYLNGFLATAWVAVRGWFWGNLVAIVLAILFVRFAAVENLLLRTALTLFCLPFVAIMPILAVTFQADTARVILAAIAVFFTTLVNTVLGLRSTEGAQLTLMRAWGGGQLDALRFVRLRAALPSIFTGLQVGAASAVLGAVFGEFIGAKQGLGVLLINGLASLNVPQIWSVAVLATLMGAVPFLLLRIVSRLLSPWSASLASAPPAVEGRRRGTLATAVSTTLWVVGSLVVVLLAWYAFLGVFHVATYVGKTPLEVFTYLFTSSASAANRSALFGELGTTLLHAGIGYALGLLFGIVAAIAFSLAPTVERVLSPLTISLQAVPIIVITPILIVIFGRGFGGVAAITTIVTFFPTLANVQNGLRRVPGDAMILMRSYDSSTLSSLWRVQLPFTLPAIFASARIAVPASVLAATVAEWLATGDGLGHVIVTAQTRAMFVELWAAAVLLTLVSLVFYAIVSAAERRVLRRFLPSSQQ